jgi:TIR domain-containing protein
VCDRVLTLGHSEGGIVKPRVFLSHSKKDRGFILRVANDLRIARVDVWYDEWEIPPGDSIRKRIFEDGIPNCDLFFVYLTENSIDSYWVQRELDSAVIHESEQNSSYISLFCNTASIRKRLSLDLRSSSIPEFNPQEYREPLIKLISKAYESAVAKQKQVIRKDYELLTLRLKNENLELQKKLLTIGVSMSDEDLISKLTSIEFDLGGITLTLLDILKGTKLVLADGTHGGRLNRAISECFGLSEADLKENSFSNEHSLSDVTGHLLIYGLMQIQPETDNTSQIYYLSEYGKGFVRQLF